MVSLAAWVEHTGNGLGHQEFFRGAFAGVPKGVVKPRMRMRGLGERDKRPHIGMWGFGEGNETKTRTLFACGIQTRWPEPHANSVRVFEPVAGVPG